MGRSRAEHLVYLGKRGAREVIDRYLGIDYVSPGGAHRLVSLLVRSACRCRQAIIRARAVNFDPFIHPILARSALMDSIIGCLGGRIWLASSAVCLKSEIAQGRSPAEL